MKYQVWYMRPEYFLDFALGRRAASVTDLPATHIHLGEFAADGLEALFKYMQGEVWSPKGEARPLILSKGLQHTSMSVGDIAIDDVGNAHQVANFGFKAIGGSPELRNPPQ